MGVLPQGGRGSFTFYGHALSCAGMARCWEWQGAGGHKDRFFLLWSTKHILGVSRISGSCY